MNDFENFEEYEIGRGVVGMDKHQVCEEGILISTFDRAC